MSSEVYSVRLTDASVIQVRGRRYSVDSDIYPGADSRYRSAFRLICGVELPTNADVCVLEVTLWDEQTGELIYTFASPAETPAKALALLDQFDPCAYLPRGHMQTQDPSDIRTRHDERARRFRKEALEFFATE
ncbi:MAG: hypothetical protein WD894_09890 [Pirellulales bacterium]